MAAARADNVTRGESRAKPAISVTRAGVVIGTDFLPDHDVTIRIIHAGEEVNDYLTYTTDHNGRLYADLPATAVTGVLRIAATDYRSDPDGTCGWLWSNTCIVSIRNV
jgi:hypothetical protein